MTAMRLTSISHPDSAFLSERIHDAPAATTTLFRDIIDATCRRFSLPGQNAKSERIERLLSAGAFVEAALALIDLELPQWQLRRIAYDGGEWYCALSRERELPNWLDQSIEGRHHDLTLSILAAFVDVQLASAPRSRPSVPLVRHDTSAFCVVTGCDNFA